MSRGWTIAIVLVGLFIAGSIMKAFEEKPTKAPKPAAPVSTYVPRQVIHASAIEIVQAYTENEVRGDQRFKGNLVEVTGRVEAVANNAFDGSPYVNLVGSGIHVVRCEFIKPDATLLAPLRRGQQVTIRGQCNGKSLTGVTLIGCRLMR